MRRVRKKVDEALQDELPVLIEGESGTGKEVLAHFLHEHSGRRGGPFVKVNCGAVPPRLLEREMFGYEAGQLGHSGEIGNGSIGLATGGMLFLDEIGDMDLALQQRVAGTMVSGRYRSEEGSTDLIADARFICSSSLDLEASNRRGVVADELLRCFPHRIRLVPLRERKADIPQISEFLADKFARSFGRPAPRLSQSVLDAFGKWNWPGNIRELENWIARIVIFGTDEAIGLEFRGRVGSWNERRQSAHRATRIRMSRTSRVRKHG